MKSSCLAIFLALSASAYGYSGCFDYFLLKDGCVNAAEPSDLRCQKPSAPKEQHTTYAFKRDPSALVSPTCKPEISNVDYDTFPAVCLWTGPDWDNPKPEAGWVNHANPSNCGKVVYIQKKDQPKTRILAKVIEGCWFQGWFHGNYTTGCSAIAVSTAVMKKLAPTHVMDHMYIGPVVWDFVKNDGHQEVSGPV
ncbi:hypothetical protein PGT21_013413 [Puccinia graminis f. sp. tritici]|uniref:Secreted protein n=1 Tax=Puccinia graminis f. sp. tritici TaxID=56615 RepID=A0A5B0RU90_PUCGR|nr:hypothetical protein PGT21_013413 [Puccinia graminis f. sp. tritici]KAA1129596.1 hypothetical protein PGTUg99_031249 [Puccinia graminis f. sp. tritici]